MGFKFTDEAAILQAAATIAAAQIQAAATIAVSGGRKVDQPGPGYPGLLISNIIESMIARGLIDSSYAPDPLPAPPAKVEAKLNEDEDIYKVIPINPPSV